MKILNFCKSYGNRRRSLIARLAIASTLSAGLCLAVVGAGQRAPADTAPQARRAPTRHWQPNVAMHMNPVAPILPNDEPIQLCQVLTPADPNPIPAVDCFTRDCPPDGAGGWDYMGPVMGFQEWAQGEYVGRARLPHVPTYRLRVDDSLDFVFRVTRNEISTPYQMNVGDESHDREHDRSRAAAHVIVLPDGTITLPLIGRNARRRPERAATCARSWRRSYKEYYKVPAITVTPVQRRHEARRPALHGWRPVGLRRPGPARPHHAGRHDPVARRRQRAGAGPDAGRVPHGTEQRFAEKIEGMEVMPVLTARAPRYVYVLGEVRMPGRYTLEAAHHGDAGHRHGRQLDRRCPHHKRRGVPPRRRLAAGRHDARPA